MFKKKSEKKESTGQLGRVVAKIVCNPEGSTAVKRRGAHFWFSARYTKWVVHLVGEPANIGGPLPFHAKHNGHLSKSTIKFPCESSKSPAIKFNISRVKWTPPPTKPLRTCGFPLTLPSTSKKWILGHLAPTAPQKLIKKKKKRGWLGTLRQRPSDWAKWKRFLAGAEGRRSVFVSLFSPIV